MQETTIPTQQHQDPLLADGAPGLVVITSNNEPFWGVIALPAAAPLTLGRGKVEGVSLDDSRMSRRHATIERAQGEWQVTDHDSTNGTFLEGAPVKGRVAARDGAMVRLGGTILLLVGDVRPFGSFGLRVDGPVVVGPTLRRAHDQIAAAGRAGQSLLILGESGSGKEMAARCFHEASRAGTPGPLVAVNCSMIPSGLAERLLFGARKGAYSGAESSSEGYFQAASGGTLFLDELAELDLAVQPKLLRTLESGEVTPLGATRPTAVDVRVVCATHGDLRTQVAEGGFRQDLYFRLARAEVSLPPLRQRREELPALVAALLSAAAPGRAPLRAEAGFIEALAGRHWPGNLRELGTEVHRAAQQALAGGRASLRPADLAPRAGLAFSAAPASSSAPVPVPSDDPIAQALQVEQGNATRAAARLGISRNKVRRWMEKNGRNPG